MSGVPYKSNALTWEDAQDYFEQIENHTVKDETQFNFYTLMKVLSSIIVLGFLALFILSIFKISSWHWSIGFIGLLGSIGLSGSIWLSKNIVTNN